MIDFPLLCSCAIGQFPLETIITSGCGSTRQYRARCKVALGMCMWDILMIYSAACADRIEYSSIWSHILIQCGTNPTGWGFVLSFAHFLFLARFQILDIFWDPQLKNILNLQGTNRPSMLIIARIPRVAQYFPLHSLLFCLLPCPLRPSPLPHSSQIPAISMHLPPLFLPPLAPLFAPSFPCFYLYFEWKSSFRRAGK